MPELALLLARPSVRVKRDRFRGCIFTPSVCVIFTILKCFCMTHHMPGHIQRTTPSRSFLCQHLSVQNKANDAAIIPAQSHPGVQSLCHRTIDSLHSLGSKAFNQLFTLQDWLFEEESKMKKSLQKLPCARIRLLAEQTAPLRLTTRCTL